MADQDRPDRCPPQEQDAPRGRTDPVTHRDRSPVGGTSGPVQSGPVQSGPVQSGPRTDRATSLGVAERIFDVLMMILFALLGLILIVLAVLLGSPLGVVGGGVVLGTVVPLWLGGRRSGGRQVRRLGWYPVAVVVLIAGLVLWVQPWA